ncbi:d83a3730-91ba-44bf-abf0-e8eb00f37d33 [Thermothielavioides terrestris]|uniref:D83a3730-91ba-44bf-abf0-e8eb00f37d33 n=1 Tax=Thermothielavioides terrestris TaxID=2587410 RepID=A0A3S4F7Y0_9PEZI|nr:d83a3730-91ba-44bf-abf0-e8eb00f37d33 [Thermothielavioides terrestris]
MVASPYALRLWLPLAVAAVLLLSLGIRHNARHSMRFGRPETAAVAHSPAAPSASPTPADGNTESEMKSPGTTEPETAESGAVESVDWSRFAYVQYVTNSVYLCNSVMLFERLQQVGSRADRVMMYPSWMMGEGGRGRLDDRRLLLKARDEYNVRLVPIEVLARPGQDPTWAESFTKLLAFNQTQYARVLSLDSDANVLQNLDELFLLPPPQ